MSKLGVALYRYLFRPLNALGYGNLVRQGPVDTFLAFMGRRQLRAWVDQQLKGDSAPGPPQSEAASAGGLCLAYLAGDSQRDLLFTSLNSLHRHWPDPPAIRLISDGALSEPMAQAFERRFPTLSVIRESEQHERIEQVLPRDRFPVLRGVRDQYLHLRKMLDVFTLPAEWILLLDADTMFVAQPSEIITRLQARKQSFYLLDRHDDAYGYPHEALQALIDSPLLRRINAGLLALPTSAIDWQQVEHWLTVLSAEHGLNYFVEQALWSLILSTGGAVPLEPSEYICEPTRRQIRSQAGAFHHYVWPCRYLFYGHGWQQIARA